MASRTDERDNGEVVSSYEERLFELGGGETESLLPKASHHNRTIPRIAHLARQVTDGPVFLGGVASLRERCIIVIGGGAGLEAAPEVRSCREGNKRVRVHVRVRRVRVKEGVIDGQCIGWQGKREDEEDEAGFR